MTSHCMNVNATAWKCKHNCITMRARFPPWTFKLPMNQIYRELSSNYQNIFIRPFLKLNPKRDWADYPNRTYIPITINSIIVWPPAEPNLYKPKLRSYLCVIIANWHNKPRRTLRHPQNNNDNSWEKIRHVYFGKQNNDNKVITRAFVVHSVQGWGETLTK